MSSRADEVESSTRADEVESSNEFGSETANETNDEVTFRIGGGDAKTDESDNKSLEIQSLDDDSTTAGEAHAPAQTSAPATMEAETSTTALESKNPNNGAEEKKEDVVSLDEAEGAVIIKLYVPAETKTDSDGSKDTSANALAFIEVEKKSAFISKAVAVAMENDPQAKELPIMIIPSVLGLVGEYMRHHNGLEPPIIEKPLRSKIMKDVCKDKWDATFIDRIGGNKQDLYNLILAANYLDIKSLLHLGCAKVASLIKGQPLEKIKEILAITPQAAATSSVSSSSGTSADPSGSSSSSSDSNITSSIVQPAVEASS